MVFGNDRDAAPLGMSAILRIEQWAARQQCQLEGRRHRATLWDRLASLEGEHRAHEVDAAGSCRCVTALAIASAAFGVSPSTYRIDHVTDGDTVVLRNGQRVRLVQIDTPEVYFGTECYGPQASATTKRLLPPGTRVRLLPEPATDRVDQYGRLLRYVVRDTRRAERQPPARRCWSRRALLLQGTQGRGREPARSAREASQGQEARAVGRVPTHGVRPVPRR